MRGTGERKGLGRRVTEEEHSNNRVVKFLPDSKNGVGIT